MVVGQDDVEADDVANAGEVEVASAVKGEGDVAGEAPVRDTRLPPPIN